MARNELSPVAKRERFFTAPGFMALWASLAMGIPAIALGASLGAPDQMALTFIQILLVVPLGLIIGGAVMAAVGWMAADTGVPTGLLFRPSLGIAGSWIASLFQALLYLGWAAIEIQLLADLVVGVVAEFGYEVSIAVSIGISTALLAGLVWLGMASVASFVRRFTFWIVLALMIWLAWDVVSGADVSALRDRIPDRTQFWLGIDMVVAFVVLFVPLAGDTARFAPTTGAATSAVGLGFGVGLGAMLFIGTTAGMSGQMDGTLGSSISYFDVAAGPLALVIGILWLVSGEFDQPFGFVYGAATGLATTTKLRAPVWLLLAVVALAGAVAALVSQGSMIAVGQFLLAVFSPLLAILVADFFFVRDRRYLADGLYQTRGPYQGVNLYGALAFLVAFVLQQWIRPSGPVAWVDFVEQIPGAGNWGASGVPAMIVGMVVAFLAYTLLGRWKIEEWESVASLRI